MLPELFVSRMRSLLGEEYDEFFAAYDRLGNVGVPASKGNVRTINDGRIGDLGLRLPANG